MSGLIIGVLVAMWAVVLIPMWLYRNDRFNAVASVDRFGRAMWVLSRRGAPTGGVGRRWVVMPQRPRGAATPVLSTQAAAPGRGWRPAADGTAATSRPQPLPGGDRPRQSADRAAAPGAAPRRAVPAERSGVRPGRTALPRRVARRRRLLLLAVTAVVVTALPAALHGGVALGLHVFTDVLFVAVLGHLRAAVLADRHTAAHSRYAPRAAPRRLAPPRAHTAGRPAAAAAGAATLPGMDATAPDPQAVPWRVVPGRGVADRPTAAVWPPAAADRPPPSARAAAPATRRTATQLTSPRPAEPAAAAATTAHLQGVASAASGPGVGGGAVGGDGVGGGLRAAPLVGAAVPRTPATETTAATTAAPARPTRVTPTGQTTPQDGRVVPGLGRVVDLTRPGAWSEGWREGSRRPQVAPDEPAPTVSPDAAASAPAPWPSLEDHAGLSVAAARPSEDARSAAALAAAQERLIDQALADDDRDEAWVALQSEADLAHLLRQRAVNE